MRSDIFKNNISYIIINNIDYNIKMVKVFIGKEDLVRKVDIRVVNLENNKSRSFPLRFDKKTKAKDYNIEKIRDLIQKLLNEHIQKEGELKLK
jgi:hypothetical protein